jgi:hypothetical protein
MCSTYTSGTSPNDALIFVPTITAPSISINCSILLRSGDRPWKAMLRAERYVHTNACVVDGNDAILYRGADEAISLAISVDALSSYPKMKVRKTNMISGRNVAATRDTLRLPTLSSMAFAAGLHSTTSILMPVYSWVDTLTIRSIVVHTGLTVFRAVDGIRLPELYLCLVHAIYSFAIEQMNHSKGSGRLSRMNAFSRYSFPSRCCSPIVNR